MGKDPKVNLQRRLGVHTSIAGGIHLSLERARVKSGVKGQERGQVLKNKLLPAIITHYGKTDKN